MNRPEPGWLDRLPTDRLMAEMSLWSADLGCLADDMARLEPHTDLYHIDVADGHFVPTLLFFPDLVAALRKHTRKPFHVHLMVSDDVLEAQIAQFAEAGADLVSVHAEARNVEAALALIERRSLPAGLVLKLHTPVAAAAPWLGRVRFLTLLGTELGVKGKGLDASAGARLEEAGALIAARGLAERVVLAADGGIREATVPILRQAGAQTIVMGSLAFGAPDIAARMAWVHAQGTAR